LPKGLKPFHLVNIIYIYRYVIFLFINNNVCFWICIHENCFKFSKKLNLHLELSKIYSSLCLTCFCLALNISSFFNSGNKFLGLLWVILSQVTNLGRRTGMTASKLLHVRELYGNIIPFSKGKCNFKEEFQKIQISQPVVCWLEISL